MKSIISNTLLLAGALVFIAFGQTKDAYQQDSKTGTGLLDPSRLTVHHSLSMGMSSSTMSSLQSQSLYSTMLQYQFAQPVTLNLNFGLPIYNTANQFQNLNTSNIKSADYFKNMPFDATLSWKPRDNMLLQFSVIRRTVNDYLSNNYFSPLDRQRDYRGNLW